MPTYRQLLDAINEAKRLEATAETAALNRDRYRGYADMRDRAEAWVEETNNALNQQIEW